MAEKQKSHEETWYGLMKTIRIPISVKFIPIKVEIPRCSTCEKRHSKAMLPYLICFFSFAIWFGYKLYCSGWGEEWYGYLLGILYTFAISAVVAAIFGIPVRYLINKVWKDTKDEGNTRDYEPIRKLIGCGFQYTKPDPAGSQGRKTVSEYKLSLTLKSIKEKGAYLIQNE